MNDRLEQLHKLHAADPEDADITYMIAMEHAKLDDASGGDPAAVIDWLNKTLDLDPNYLYAYFQKAKAQSEQGNDETAKATLQLGIQKAKSALDSKAVSELSELHESME
jgi:tetratricopeptide (TPR) repeat protein